PMAQLLGSFTEPLLAPARRLLPATGGLDLSPIIVFMVLMLVLKLLVQPLLDVGRMLI
ncbi:MAG TPA: YggT family protein, partial [Gammaproteobacteria bacterium]|nr:YggT family protein [Gammaproteobacteria bacterium]